MSLLALPVMALVGYATLVADYRRNLDSNMSYIQPALAAAPEDVLGFGFWPTWTLALAVLILLCTLAYRFATHAKAYYVAVAVTFALLSAADFTLYHSLEKQVLGH